jgi:regulatory protein
VAYGCVFLTMTREITAIEPQKKNPERVNIYLDGEFAFGLEAILAAWLKIGQSLSEEKINALIAGDALESAYLKALHFMSFRPRSVFEVRKNLQGRDIPEAILELTLERLQESSLLNDLRFAQDWITNRKDFRPRSSSALRMELRMKGISEDVIQTALAKDVDDDTLALQAARKYMHRLESQSKLEFRKKLSAHLSRRGFSYTFINPVVMLVWNELHPATDHRESPDNEDY